MSSRPAKRRCDAAAGEYVCLDGTRVAATNASAIDHDRRVRAVLDAAHRLSSFVPPDVAMSDFVCVGRATKQPGRSVQWPRARAAILNGCSIRQIYKRLRTQTKANPQSRSVSA